VLHLHLLGGIELLRDGQPVLLPPSRKTRALLAYLATTGRRQRRERLCTMFWDVPDDPRGALRWSLSRLRAAVGDDARERIVADREAVELDAGDMDIDVLAVRRGLADTALDVDGLARLVARFRGEFLEGLELTSCPEFHSWCIAEREDLRQLHVQALDRLVALLGDQPDTAAGYARLLVRRNPGSEAARATLVRLLARAGRLREAEEQYELGLKALTELGAPPAGELDRVWRDVRRPAARPVSPPASPSAAERPGLAATAPVRATSSPPAGRPTIAVLPFADRGGGDYFSRGISQDIASELSRFDDLVVIAPSTTEHLERDQTSVVDLARTLGAAFVLDGSAQRAGAQVRIAVQLLDGETGSHVSAERYDRAMDDIFAVQDEITRRVAAAIGLRLREEGLQRTLRKPTTDLTAYECVLRARRYVSVLTEQEHARARDWLEEAVRKDPAYAEAHAALSFVYVCEFSQAHNPRPGALDRAIAAGRQAVELDPRSGPAHAALAIAHFFRQERSLFVDEAERALALNPNDPDMTGQLGAYLTYAGRTERGIELLSQAMELNPLHPTWYFYSFVVAHTTAGDYARALEAVERVDMPDFLWTLLLKSALLWHVGRTDEAAALHARFRIRYPEIDAGTFLRRWIASEVYVARIMEGFEGAGRS
jgi:TolB-like protein/DNA-binding SARP family transcriptional activator/Tfp pilus assembly protein PilF